MWCVQNIPAGLCIELSEEPTQNWWSNLQCWLFQNHVIQSAYFGHGVFALLTPACYFSYLELDKNYVDHDSGLSVQPLVIVPTETVHEWNIAFSSNNKLIEIICTIISGLKTFYFWSDWCASQFRFEFVFCSLCCYPSALKIYWDYGAAHHFKVPPAHHFKVPHDGICGTVKRKI